MLSLRPFLQIVHLSDVHIVAPEFRPTHDPVRLRMWLRRLRRLASASGLRGRVDDLDRLIREGCGAHLPQARPAFAQFLKRLTIEDPQFRSLTTWVVQSGDLTTFGDDPSLNLATTFLDSAVAPTGALTVSIHGNHDAWPGTFPLLGRAALEAHQTALRHRFPDPWLSGPLRVRLPDATGEVQLYQIDTVDWGPIENAWARGAVSEYRLDDLSRAVGMNTVEGERQLRILVCHHPIRYPPPRPALTMHLKDDGVICEALRTGHRGGVRPLAHMILSGHTHCLSPCLYALPESVNGLDQPPLGDWQCQLVVGSLAQVRHRAEAEVEEGNLRTCAAHSLCEGHQCQVLRFFYDNATPRVVLVQRLVAVRRQGNAEGRGVGFGPFEIPDDRSVQVMSFEI